MIRRAMLKLHRWLGLAAAVLWLLQAVTGMLLSFHWELDGASRSDIHRPTDFAAIERRMVALAPSGSAAKVNWIFTTAGLPDQYVISMADAGGLERMVRIDGAGLILGDRPADEPGFFKLVLEIHESLAAGKTGGWIIGISGALLLSNLVFGVVISWPRRGRWREVLKPVSRGGLSARLYSWHRAIGMWAVIPASLVIATGTLIIFESGFRTLIGAPEVTLPANSPRSVQVGFAKAAQAAASAIPGAVFVGTALPGPEDASYYISVRAPGEPYRAYAGSLVVIDANTGSVRGAYPIAEADVAHKIVGWLYPLHTGESGGMIGRVLTMLVGLWLAVMIVAGVWLWWRRRPKQRRS